MNEGQVIAIGAPPTFRHQVARALAVEPASIEWVPTVAAAESVLTEHGKAPSVLVLSPTIKEPDAFGLAEFVGRTAPTTAVLLVRDRTVNMNGLLTKAMRSGVRDVIDLSHGGEELREAMKRALAWSENLRSTRGAGAQAPEARGMVISVFSSKGGTGKTFLASNLATAIAEETKQDTALLDLELAMGDAFSYFGKEPTQPLQDLVSLGDLSDPDAIRDAGTKLLPRVWGYGSPPDPTAGNGVTGETMGKVVRALRSAFPHTVVDGTNQYSDPALASFDLSDSICLVAALDIVGLRHMSVALQTFLSLGFPRDRFRIVLNRADSKVGLDVGDVERVLKLKVDAAIPSSRLVPTSLNRGRPVVLEEPRSEVSKAVTAFALRLAVPVEASGQKRKLFGRR